MDNKYTWVLDLHLTNNIHKRKEKNIEKNISILTN